MQPTPDSKLAKIFAYKFSIIYDLYLQKVVRKNRTKEELDNMLFWLTGHDTQTLQNQIDSDNDLQTFFDQCPNYNHNSSNITGLICGVRIEEIENPLIRKIRQMDKVVDELAKGKLIQKILNNYEKSK